jgi:hypothetical protein
MERTENSAKSLITIQPFVIMKHPAAAVEVNSQPSPHRGLNCG